MMRVPNVVVLLVCVSALIPTAFSSSITWSTASQITGDSDVLTGGTLQEAYNFGPGGITSTTVNGELFSNFASNNLLTDTVGNITLSGASAILGAGIGTFGSASPPYVGISSAYQALLGSGVYVIGSPMLVTISGLTSGLSYEVEVWVNDSRGAVGPNRADTLSGTTNQVIDFNTGAEGGLGQFTIGTFIASGSTQSFSVAGFDSTSPGSYASQLNGIEVIQGVSIPEPSSIGMVGLGAGVLALGFARRRCRASKSC